MLMDRLRQHQRQASLLAQVDDVARRSDALMSVLDSINARYGRDTLAVAAAGTRKDWVARREQDLLLHDPREGTAKTSTH